MSDPRYMSYLESMKVFHFVPLAYPLWKAWQDDYFKRTAELSNASQKTTEIVGRQTN